MTNTQNTSDRSPTRLLIVGTVGAGKTELSKRLSDLLHMPHVELDAYRHGPDWTESPDDEFRAQLADALQGDSWIADGNYSVARDVVWPRGRTLVWLDYPITLVMWRLLRRTLRRSLQRQELWNGNRETLLRHFFSRQSLFLWALQSHWLRRKTIPSALAQPEHSHLELVHLRSPEETDRWLDSLEHSVNGAAHDA